MKHSIVLIAFVTVILLSCEQLDIHGRGYISITTQPTGCEVYLDGELQNETAYSLELLTKGV